MEPLFPGGRCGDALHTKPELMGIALKQKYHHAREIIVHDAYQQENYRAKIVLETKNEKVSNFGGS